MLRKICLLMLILISCGGHLKNDIKAILENDDTAKLEEMLDQGISPDYKLMGHSLLELACEQNKTEMVSVLLRGGANTAGCIGSTCDSPIAVACFEGNEQIVNLLLSYNANMNSQNKLGQTALMYAAMNGYGKICEALLLQRSQTLGTAGGARLCSMLFNRTQKLWELCSSMVHHQLLLTTNI